MKEINKVSLVLKSDTENDLDEYGDIVSRYIIKNALIGFIISFIVSFCLLALKDYISPIVKIEIGLFTEIIVIYTVITLIIFTTLLILLKKKPNFWKFKSEKKSLKKYFSFGYVFDLVNFFISSLLVVYLFLLFIITPTTVVGRSMEKTFSPDDRILVLNAFYKPKRDDVVVIDANKYSFTNEGNFYIKRIVAMPNDLVRLVEDGIIVNSNLYKFEGRFDRIESYLSVLNTQQGYYVIPEGKYLLLGDNRAYSSDSRTFGLVDEEQILGRAFMRFWPINKIKLT